MAHPPPGAALQDTQAERSQSERVGCERVTPEPSATSPPHSPTHQLAAPSKRAGDTFDPAPPQVTSLHAPFLQPRQPAGREVS